jgi:four helix bundle suffix protein
VVARAGTEACPYERQRGLEQWEAEHPALVRFKAKRCETLGQIQEWVRNERELARTGKPARTNTDTHGQTRTKSAGSVEVRDRPCLSVGSPAQLAANAALSLLNVCCRLLDRQLASQAKAFVAEGGFTERLYRVRNARRGETGLRHDRS